MGKRQALPAFLFLLVLTLALVAYMPGLNGGFLFDDFGNLPALGAGGPVDHWPTFWRYITSGTADPIGRPLTLLSFLLDARDWPAAPYPFIRTNLILHLFNSVLLAWLLRRLGRVSFFEVDQHRIDMAAVLGAGFWLLHPLFVSTTLYIVQREAMLPATFTLLGLLSWLRGRSALQCERNFSGLLWIVLGLGGCTVMGILSKANGILLPALALVIEYTLLRTNPVGRSGFGNQRLIYRNTMALLAWLPTTVLAAYLLEQGWLGLTRGISALRPWTMGQRLLTEPRVLMDYLALLWLPRPFTPGLFNDHVQPSISLWSPGTTLPSFVALAGLIVGACMLRRRWPAVALATLFYFVGMSLESSTVALELFFEHRNYLPAMLMFWPLALWLCGVPVSTHSPVITPRRAGSVHGGLEVEASPKTTDRHRFAAQMKQLNIWSIAKPAIAVFLVLGLGLITRARTELWGSTHEQTLLWAMLNPDSPRALANAAITEMETGAPANAVALLKPALTKSPEQVQLALNLFSAQCQLGSVDQITLTAVHTALRTTRDPGSLLVNWFGQATSQAEHPPCQQMTYDTLAWLLNAIHDNPFLMAVPGRQQDLYYLQGQLALHQGHADLALIDFNRALDVEANESIALEQAALLGSMGSPRLGLAHLDHYEMVRKLTPTPELGMPRIHAWVLQREQYWPKEMAHLRAVLNEDANRQITGKP